MALVSSPQQPTTLMVALDRLGVPNTEALRSGLALSLVSRRIHLRCQRRPGGGLALAALPGDPLLAEDPRGGR